MNLPLLKQVTVDRVGANSLCANVRRTFIVATRNYE